MDTIKMILVDDHDIVREGLKALLTGNRKISVTGEAGSSEELFSLLETQKPDVLVLDIQLPTLSGIEIARIIQKDFPDIRTLILSAEINENTIADAMDAGVLGILPKHSSRSDFIAAATKVAAGEQFYSDFVTGLILKNYLRHKPISDKYSKASEVELSDREIEIIRCFSDGLSYKQIADKLFISERTVESHKVNIMRKTGLRTIIDLVKFAIKNKIAEL